MQEVRAVEDDDCEQGTVNVRAEELCPDLAGVSRHARQSAAGDFLVRLEAAAEATK